MPHDTSRSFSQRITSRSIVKTATSAVVCSGPCCAPYYAPKEPIHYQHHVSPQADHWYDDRCENQSHLLYPDGCQCHSCVDARGMLRAYAPSYPEQFTHSEGWDERKARGAEAIRDYHHPWSGPSPINHILHRTHDYHYSKVRQVKHTRPPYPRFRCCETDTHPQQHRVGHDWVKETKAKTLRRHSHSGHQLRSEPRSRSESASSLTSRLSLSPQPSITSISHWNRGPGPVQVSVLPPAHHTTSGGQPVLEVKRSRAPKKSRLPLPISGPGSGGYLTYRLGTNPFPVESNASDENVTNTSFADGQNAASKTSPSLASLSAKTLGRAPEAVVKHLEHPTRTQVREGRDARERREKSNSMDLEIEMRTEQDSEAAKPRFRSAYVHNEVNVSVTLRPARE